MCLICCRYRNSGQTLMPVVLRLLSSKKLVPVAEESWRVDGFVSWIESVMLVSVVILAGELLLGIIQLLRMLALVANSLES